MLNLVGFPATITKHYTVGYSKDFSKRFSLDLAYVHAPEESNTTEFNGGGGDMTIDNKHSQTSFSLGGRWNF